MHFNERFLQRLAKDRTLALSLEAQRLRQSRASRTSWRTKLAHTLMALAERLEPKAAGRHRQLAGH